MAPWDLDAFFMSLPLVTHSASLAVVVVFGGASHSIHGEKKENETFIIYGILLELRELWMPFEKWECWKFGVFHLILPLTPHESRTSDENSLLKEYKKKFLAWALCSCGISTIFHCILPFFSSCYFLVTKRLEFSAFSRFYLRFSFHHKLWDCIQQRKCGCLINIHPEIPDRFQLSLSLSPLHWDCAKTHHFFSFPPRKFQFNFRRTWFQLEILRYPRTMSWYLSVDNLFYTHFSI